MGIFRAFKRIFVYLGLMAEQATETDAINQAMVERGIRDAKAKAEKAHYANGQLAGQIALLKDQVKRQERQRAELQGLLQAAAAANDEGNGAHFAEELGAIEGEITENKSQLESLEVLYKQNTEIIANSLREIQNSSASSAVKARSPSAVPQNLLADEGSISDARGGGRRAGPVDAATPPVAAGGEGRPPPSTSRGDGFSIQRQQE